jgi:hypothetical protein
VICHAIGRMEVEGAIRHAVEGRLCFAGIGGPVGTPRSDVRGVAVFLGMVPLFMGDFVPSEMPVRAVFAVHVVFLLGVRALFVSYTVWLRVNPGAGLFGTDTDTDALYASLSRSSRSRRSIASTHSTTVEVDIERSL